MTQILTELGIGIVNVIVTSLGSLLIYYISKTIKDEKIKNMLLEAAKIVEEGVSITYQTFVEELKGTEEWNETTMEQAKTLATFYIENNLSPKIGQFITANKGDLKEWISNQIEIAIKKSKDKNKEKTA